MHPNQVQDDPLTGLRPSRTYERAAAHLIDLAVLFIVQLPLTLLIFPRVVSGDLINLILLSSASLLLFLLYFTLSEGFFSTTIGKKALGLRVVSLTHMRRVSLTESFIRNLFRFSDMLALYLPVLLFKGGRRIGDVLANTVVVSRDFLRVELPPSGSPISEELRRSIVIATYHELKHIAGELGFELPRYESPLREYISGTIGIERDDLLNFILHFLSNERFQVSTLGIDGIARIYERASEFCDGYPSRILKRRAEIIRAFASESIGSYGGIAQILKTAPVEFVVISRYFLISLALFTLSSVIAYYFRPQWVADLIREILGREAVPREADPLTLTALIFLNNLRVVLATLGTSPLVVMPFLTLIANGLIVGLAISLYGDPLKVMLLILPHGIPELSSIFIFTALGMKVCWQLLKGEEKWFRARKTVMGSLNLVTFSIFLLLYAAIVEGFLTKSLAENPIADVSFSLIEGFLIYAYLLTRARAPPEAAGYSAD